MAATPIGQIYPTRCQVADTLPALDSGWTTMDGLIPRRAQEGVGQIIGMGECWWYYGNVSFPGEQSVLETDSLDLNGQFIRFQIDDGDGWETVWTGLVPKTGIASDGATDPAGGIQRFACQGLASILDMIYVNQGYVYGYNTSTGAREMMYVMTCPIFNNKPTQYQTTLGNRSQLQKNLGDNDIPSYYFDLVTPYGPWSAADILNYLFAGYAQPQVPPTFEPMGPTWVLSDPLDLLTYIPEKIDLNGKSLLDCLNSLVNPRRGITWRAYPSGNTIAINIYSTSPVELTVGDVTIAASSLPVDLDWTNNPYIPLPDLTIDTTSQFDVIQVMANCPLTGITGSFTRGSGSAANAFVEGWDTDNESTYDSSLNQGPVYENMFRRFVLLSGWNGLQQQITGSAASVGLRNLLDYTGTGSHTLAQIAAFGWGGYTGLRSFSSTSDDNNAPAQMLKLDKFIPLPYASYATTPTIGDVDMTQPLLAPCLYAYDAGGSGTWIDLTDEYDIDIEQDPPAVVLSGDMDQLQGLITNTNVTLFITLGIREADPLTVSWQNATESETNYVSQVPRIMVRTVPYIEQWIALQGTILGIAPGAASAYTLTSSLTTIDDTPKLQAWLSYLRAWYGSPDVSCSWTDHSRIDIDTDTGTFQPGALVATVNRGDAFIPCNGIVMARAWDFTDENWGTSYSTERIIPDIDSLDSHPRITRIWKSQDERLGNQ